MIIANDNNHITGRIKWKGEPIIAHKKIHEGVLQDMFSFSLLKIIKFEKEISVVLLKYDPNWGYVFISLKQR